MKTPSTSTRFQIGQPPKERQRLLNILVHGDAEPVHAGVHLDMDGHRLPHGRSDRVKLSCGFQVIDGQLDVVADRLMNQPDRRVAEHQDRAIDAAPAQFNALGERGDGEAIHARGLGNGRDDAGIMAVGVGLDHGHEQRPRPDDGANLLDVVDQRAAVDLDPGGAVGLWGCWVVGHRCSILVVDWGQMIFCTESRI